MLGDEEEATVLDPENDCGNIEYKLKLVSPTADRLTHLISQMNFRLSEGLGEAIYEIGVQDDGVPEGLSDEDLAASIATLRRMARALEADISVLRSRRGIQGRVAEVLVRKLAHEQFHELRIAVAGNVESGKSTLLGVLAYGEHDNGNGLARLNLLRHKHELQTGHTSCLSQEIIGFDATGAIVNYGKDLSEPSWSEICALSAKVVTFIDLAGHERYLRTTLFGLTVGNTPDYCMVTVAANTGVTAMTREHLGVALGLQVPLFVVITKTDAVSPAEAKRVVKGFSKLAKEPGVLRIPVLVRSADDVLLVARSIVSDRIMPIFMTSSVTGENLDILRTFLNLLPARIDWEQRMRDAAEFQIEETFTVTDVGTVVGGVVTSGTVRVDDELLLGPADNGSFLRVAVTSIQAKRRNVRVVRAGQSCSLAISVPRECVQKDMLLVDPATQPVAVFDFEANIVLLASQQAALAEGYEGVFHCANMGVPVKVVALPTTSQGELHGGAETPTPVVFRFLYRQRYVKVGARFVLRQERSKAIGTVTKLFHAGYVSVRRDPAAAAAVAAAALLSPDAEHPETPTS